MNFITMSFVETCVCFRTNRENTDIILLLKDNPTINTQKIL